MRWNEKKKEFFLLLIQINWIIFEKDNLAEYNLAWTIELLFSPIWSTVCMSLSLCVCAWLCVVRETEKKNGPKFK